MSNKLNKIVLSVFFVLLIIVASCGNPENLLTGIAGRLPEVQTLVPTSVAKGTATFQGTVSGECDKIGFDWGLNSGDYSGNWSGDFIGNDFAYTLNGLTEGIPYYYRAKAHNQVGWSYGNEVKFIDPWVTGYTYRKEISITGATGGTTNYSVPIRIYSGSGTDAAASNGSSPVTWDTSAIVYLSNHCTDFPNDITFTDNDETTELDYWLEDYYAYSYNSSNYMANIWVEVADDLSSNQSIYIYYGKSGGTSSSDDSATMVVGADFNDGTTTGLALNTAGSATLTVENPTALHGALRCDYPMKMVDNAVVANGDTVEQAGGIADQLTDNYNPYLYSGSAVRIAERFTNFPVSTITSIDIKLSKVGSPTGTLSVTVRTVTGDTLLGTLGTKDVSTLDGTPTFYTFNTTPVANASVQDIRISAEYSGGDASNKVQVQGCTPSAYANGVFSYYISSWTDLPTYDLTWQNLTYTEVVEAWDYTACRDFTWVTDSNNRIVVFNDGADYIVGYYHGWNSTTDSHAIGRVISRDGGKTATKYANNPVFEGSGGVGEFDRYGVGGPTVKYLPGVGPDTGKPYKMIYQGNSLTGSNDNISLGLAESADGITWTRYASNPILEYSSYSDVSLIAVPHMINYSGGGYALVGEAQTTAAHAHGNDKWIVYGATGSDLVTWTPMNSGAEILEWGTSAWDDDGVANPKVIELSGADAGKFILSYNGKSSGYVFWRIGFATTTDAPASWSTTSWTKYTGNPVIYPSDISNRYDKNNTECSTMTVDDIETGATNFRFWFQGFNNSSISIALALFPQGRILHGEDTAVVADGHITGIDLDTVSGSFYLEFLIQNEIRDPDGYGSITYCELYDSAAVPSPGASGTLGLLRRFGIQYFANYSGTPDKIVVGYMDTGGSMHWWTISGTWGTVTYYETKGGELRVKIWDDGTNYCCDVEDAITGNSVLTVSPASIAKASVKAFSNGRVFIGGELFTNVFYCGCTFDNIILRKYGDTSGEPVVGAAGSEQTESGYMPRPSAGITPGGMIF